MSTLNLFNKEEVIGDFVYETYSAIKQVEGFSFAGLTDMDEDTYMPSLKQSVLHTNPVIDVFNITGINQVNLFSGGQQLSIENLNQKINEYKNIFWERYLSDEKVQKQEKTLKDQNMLSGYLNNIINFVYTYSALNNIWDTSFDNKVLSIGIGDFYKQTLPNFVINDINSSNKKYHFIIIEPCGDSFGCPDFETVKEFFKSHIPNKLSNIKVSLLKLESTPLIIFLSLLNLINLITKCFIIDTVGTGHSEKDTINEMNIINCIIKKSFRQFYDQNFKTSKLIYYVATGFKFIYLNTIKERFESKRPNSEPNCQHKEKLKLCELDKFNDTDLYNNNFSEFQQKYLKYKAKYLALKKLLNPNN